MLKRFWGKGRHLGIGVAVFMLIAASCTEFNNPISPNGNDPAVSQSESGETGGILTRPAGKGNSARTTDDGTSTDSADPSTSETVSAEPDYVKSKLIKARTGGYIVINTEKFWYGLEIPYGALRKDTRITMTVPDGDKSLFLLEPHGLQFKKSAKLDIYTKSEEVTILDPTPAENDPVDIYWYDDDNGVWVAQGSEVIWEPSAPNWLRAKLNIDHFSRWALGGDSPIQKWYYQSYYYGY